MSEEQPTKEENLFLHLVTTYTQSAWMALGKIKNPVTEKTERNLEEAQFYIDMLDMVKTRTRGNLSEGEEEFVDSSISSLKLNYVEESRKAEGEEKEKSETEQKAEDNDDVEDDEKGGSSS